MIPYPHIDPVLISIGPLMVRWYGIMFLMAFLGAWWLGRRRAPGAGWSAKEVDDLIFYGALGALLGGRLGWTLFYGLEYEFTDPLRVFRVWEGGMSFHGGLVGAILAFVLFARVRGRTVAEVFDFSSALPGIGLFSVRIANFINGELWGKPTTVPWGVVYEGVARHPSQLYEAFLEGIVLGTVMWLFTARPRPALAPSGLFLVGYGFFRFLVELVRVPDANRGYLMLGWVTEGQLLSFPMIVAGIVLLWVTYHRKTPTQRAVPAGGA